MATAKWSLTSRLGMRVSILAGSKTGLSLRWRCGCKAAGSNWNALAYSACAQHERRRVDRGETLAAFFDDDTGT